MHTRLNCILRRGGNRRGGDRRRRTELLQLVGQGGQTSLSFCKASRQNSNMWPGSGKHRFGRQKRRPGNGPVFHSSQSLLLSVLGSVHAHLCQRLDAAAICLELLSALVFLACFFCALGEHDKPLPDSSQKEQIYRTGLPNGGRCINDTNKRQTKQKEKCLRTRVCLLSESPLANSQGPHTPTHLQQMHSSALCEAGPRLQPHVG